MAIAKRPIFLSCAVFPYVQEIVYEFNWAPGFALLQSQKNINSLHKKALENGVGLILEISSKSPYPLGVSLSAFNLMYSLADDIQVSVECAFQSSKVFEEGGPYTDLLYGRSIDAKRDPRLINSGKLTYFRYQEVEYPINPLTAFYDWLYIKALWANSELAKHIIEYHAFSDIAFNPGKSINCQARSAALFVSLEKLNLLNNLVDNWSAYIKTISGVQPDSAAQLTLF